MSRLVEAVYETSSTLNEDYSTLYSYDIQGNIQTLKRNGPVTDDGDYFKEIDNLKYSYSGNRLTKVYNWTPMPGPYGFNNYGIFSGEGRDVYLYDANGNMRYDARTQREVEYNLLNLPRRITQSTSSSNHDIINYTYTASGQKISQQMVSDGRVATRRDYAGSFVFVNNVLAWVNTPFGRIVNKEIQPDNKLLLVQEFHIRDHLGNTRVVLEGGLGTQYSATHVADYYPFGMEFQRGVKNQITPPDGDLRNNRYLYNGKELQDDFGLDWYDYGARFYDPQIARWHSVDPLAVKYFSMSPYNYVGNNPVMRIDPDGRSFVGAYETLNHTGSADVYIYDGDGYADRLRVASGDSNADVFINGVQQFNSPPGTSGGSGSRRRGEAVNDDLPEFQGEGSKKSATVSEFNIVDNSEIDNLNRVKGVVNTSSEAIFVRPENPDSEFPWEKVPPGSSFVGPYDGFAANGVIIKVNNWQNQMNAIVSDNGIKVPRFQFTLNALINFSAGKYYGREVYTFFNVANPPSGWSNPFE